MRAVLLILVFCNVVFFMWQLTIRQPQLIPAEAEQPAGVARLALLHPPEPAAADVKQPQAEQSLVAQGGTSVASPSRQSKINANKSPAVLPEVLRAKAASPVLDAKANAVPSAMAVCYVYGVFKTEKEAAGFLQSLPSDWQAQVVSQRIWVEQGYWVKVPAPPTMALARTELESIKAKGVQDYWLVPKGRNRGVISLGLFANIRRAELRRVELKKIGVVAEIEQKRERALRYRALFQLSVAPNQALAAAGLGIELKQLERQTDCSGLGG